MIIFLIVYLIGFAVNYYIFKNNLREEDDNSYKDVLVTVIASLFSWACVFLVSLYLADEWLDKTDRKPPKWM